MLNTIQSVLFQNEQFKGQCYPPIPPCLPCSQDHVSPAARPRVLGVGGRQVAGLAPHLAEAVCPHLARRPLLLHRAAPPRADQPIRS